MINKNVTEFDNYKDYLLHQEQIRSAVARGYRTRIAEAAGCNNPFVSQVLNGDGHFSLEQALKIGRYLGLKTDTLRYFLILVEHNRASTKDLKEYFGHELDDLKDRLLDMNKRVKKDKELDVETKATYYSQWYYAAIHMIVTVPSFRTVAKISEALQLPVAKVQEVVGFLLANNLLAENKGEFIPGSSYLHLDRKSPFAARHHNNWRLVAMQELSRDVAEHVHYSTVSTLSKKDAEHLRSKLLQVIQDYVQTVACSKEETMWVFNLDFFGLLSND